MSAQNVNQILGRAMMDPEFRALLLSDPASALSGYDLTPDEQHQLSQLGPGQLSGEVDQVHFNPKEITIDKPVPWQKHKNVEGDEPTLEFTSGEPKSLNVELMFDTYEDSPQPHSRPTLLHEAASGEIISPRDAASGKPTGKRSHKPIVIARDSSSGQATGKRGHKPILLLGFVLLILLLAGGLFLGGVFNSGGPDVTTAPPATEPVVEDEPTATVEVTEAVTDVPGVLVCGQTCQPGSACAQGLVCEANASGVTTCGRNGHCGCGVPCDGSASACDPGLKCEVRGGQSVCWAGGCEPTSTPDQPTCQPVPGDGTCSACEDAQTDPQSCGSGGDDRPCKCKCSRVCDPNGGNCRTACKDCNGKSCSK